MTTITISVPLTPLQEEYLKKMESRGFSREEIMNLALNFLMEKADVMGEKTSSTTSSEPKLNIPLILVEAGRFNPIPSYKVQLSSFYIGKYPVLQKEYSAVMGCNPAHDYGVGDDYPVYYVCWLDIIEFCNRLSLREGYTPCFSYGAYGKNPDLWAADWKTNHEKRERIVCDWAADGYRLPTEMEWMFAAKGGNKSKNYLYSGSNHLDEVGWYRENWGQEEYSTHAVGAKKPNELGIYEMSGNVWELVWDVFAPYPSGTFTNPRGPENGLLRARRGGGWYFSGSVCSVLTRGDTSMEHSGGSMGFRICRNA